MAKKPKIDQRKALFERILTEMKGGRLPWRKAWNTKRGETGQHYNAISGQPYQGSNQINLMMIGLQYQSNAWVTYKQAKQLGGHVREGEKASYIFKPIPLYKKDKTTGEKTDEKTGMMFSACPVWNLDQCDNINHAEKPAPDTQPLVIEHSTVLEMFRSIGFDIRHGGDKAFYTPSGDFIQSPHQADFISLAHYDHTLSHEGVHMTGHKSRLDRDGMKVGDKKVYAFEELVAELGAAIISSEFGLDASDLGTPAYLQGWIKELNDNPNVFWKAASKASEAVEFIRTELYKSQIAIAA